MCFLCDGGTLDELRRRIDDAIDDRGWFIQAVDAGGDAAGWAYTIGLAERFGHPELVVVDPHCVRCGGNLLNAVAQEVAEGAAFRPDDAVYLDGRSVARIAAVHAEEWATDRFNGWLVYYDAQPWASPPARALQVVWGVDGGGFQDGAWNVRWPSDCLATPPRDRPSPWRPGHRLNRHARRATGRARHRRSR